MKRKEKRNRINRSHIWCLRNRRDESNRIMSNRTFYFHVNSIFFMMNFSEVVGGMFDMIKFLNDAVVVIIETDKSVQLKTKLSCEKI